MKKVLFLGFDKKLGLTYQFVDWIIALDKVVSNILEIMFLTLKKEQNVGLHEKLQNLEFINVMTINSHDYLENLEFLEKVDIVHCHGFRQVARMLKIKKDNKLKFSIIITMHSFRHGTWLRPFYANIVSFLYLNKVDVVHYLSQKSKDEFLQFNLFYRHTNCSFVCPLGCNKEEFLKDEKIQDLEFYKELSESQKNVICLANFSKVKQQLWLIRCIKNILVRENAKLWLFGKGVERGKVIKYVEENGLSQYVKLPGRVDRKYIPFILSKMDLAICVSKSETFGHLIMEPMFAGIPVVTFDVGIAGYLIRDFTTGFVVKNKSEKQNFVRAIRFLLKNRDAAIKMGDNAKLFANRWLTWESTSENIFDMYCSM